MNETRERQYFVIFCILMMGLGFFFFSIIADAKTFTITDGIVNITWNPPETPAGITAYNVYLFISECHDGVKIATVLATSTLKAQYIYFSNQTIWVWVRSVNAQGIMSIGKGEGNYGCIICEVPPPPPESKNMDVK